MLVVMFLAVVVAGVKLKILKANHNVALLCFLLFRLLLLV